MLTLQTKANVLYLKEIGSYLAHHKNINIMFIQNYTRLTYTQTLYIGILVILRSTIVHLHLEHIADDVENFNAISNN